MAEGQSQLDTNNTNGKRPIKPHFNWPHSISSFASEQCKTAAAGPSGDIRATAACVAALRLAHTFNLRNGSAWCDEQERALSEHCALLRADDEDFGQSLKAIHSSGVLNHGGGGGSGPAALRILRILGAYDAFYWACWALACRLGVRVPHPVRVAEQVQHAVLTTASGAIAVRRILLMDRHAAHVLGTSKAWVDLKDEDLHITPAWRPGEAGSALLRYRRARWVEACGLHVPNAGAAADASDSRVRAALLRWQLIGRDLSARHMAFAVPCLRAGVAIGSWLQPGSAEDTDKAGCLVDLGSGNGYWAQHVLRSLKKMKGVCHSVVALDAVPPPDWRQPRDVKVQFGTAEYLSRFEAPSSYREPEAPGSPRVLLLCMPSPGEPGIAEDAINAFTGKCVAYVGEWRSGMTGTRELHDLLEERFELMSCVPLPCMPLTRIALHMFQRRDPELHGRASWKGGRTKETRECNPALEVGGASCSNCKALKGLKSCPWTRTHIVCSERCHAASAAKHEASISWLYCGAKLPVGKRPKLKEFHSGAEVHLEEKAASDAEWLRLAQATPQPERELPP